MAHLCIGIAENEPNGSEEITLAGSVAPDNDIVLGRKGFDSGLLLVTAIAFVS